MGHPRHTPQFSATLTKKSRKSKLTSPPPPISPPLPLLLPPPTMTKRSSKKDEWRAEFCNTYDSLRSLAGQDGSLTLNVTVNATSNPETVKLGEGAWPRINGCSVGDGKFAHILLDKTTYAAGATIKKVDTQLRAHSCLAVHGMYIYANQTLLQHLAQTVEPSTVTPYLERKYETHFARGPGGHGGGKMRC